MVRSAPTAGANQRWGLAINRLSTATDDRLHQYQKTIRQIALPWHQPTEKIMSSADKLSRRAMMRGAVAAMPILAGTTSAAIADTQADAELIALGERFEPLFLDYMNSWLEWAPRWRAANAEIGGLRDDWAQLTREQCRAHANATTAAHQRHGAEAAGERMTALYGDVDMIAAAINEAPALSLAGLRAKALVFLWEARPGCAEHEGSFHFQEGDDGTGSACRSLIEAVAELTGLGPMMWDIETRLAADAAGSS
jgi:hypothetical protein